MNGGQSYIRQLKSINESMSRYNSIIKELRQKKKDVESKLYLWMEKRNIESYEGVTLKKISPKPKRKRNADKKADAIRLFTQMGITDPESFWEEFQRTQKIIPEDEE